MCSGQRWGNSKPAVLNVEHCRSLLVDPQVLSVVFLCVVWVILDDATGLVMMLVSDAPLLLALLLVGGYVRNAAEKANQQKAWAAQRRHEQQQRLYSSWPRKAAAHCGAHHAAHKHGFAFHLNSPSIEKSTKPLRSPSPSCKSTASSSNTSSSSCTSSSSKRRKLTEEEKTEACVRFNHGKCNALASGCKFGHFCMLCGKGHVHAARSEQCPFREVGSESGHSNSTSSSWSDRARNRGQRRSLKFCKVSACRD